MFRSILTAGLVLALTACGAVGTAPATTQQQVATGCASASAAIKALTLANQFGKLTAEQQGQVLTAIGVTNPVCAAEQAPTLDSLKLAAFLQAIALLQREAAQLETTP